MSTEDWNTFLDGQLPSDDLADLSADELFAALTAHGICVLGCDGDEGRDVIVSLDDLRGAEALMTLAFEEPAGPGTLYDRATGGCVALNALAGQYDGESPQDAVDAAVTAGWTWVVHPHLEGRVTHWHVSVTLPCGDANQLTARLNELKRGYAL